MVDTIMGIFPESLKYFGALFLSISPTLFSKFFLSNENKSRVVKRKNRLGQKFINNDPFFYFQVFISLFMLLYFVFGIELIIFIEYVKIIQHFNVDIFKFVDNYKFEINFFAFSVLFGFAVFALGLLVTKLGRKSTVISKRLNSICDELRIAYLIIAVLIIEVFLIVCVINVIGSRKDINFEMMFLIFICCGCFLLFFRELYGMVKMLISNNENFFFYTLITDEGVLYCEEIFENKDYFYTLLMTSQDYENVLNSSTSEHKKWISKAKLKDTSYFIINKSEVKRIEVEKKLVLGNHFQRNTKYKELYTQKLKELYAKDNQDSVQPKKTDNRETLRALRKNI